MQLTPADVADVWVPILGALGAFLAFSGGAVWWVITRGHKIISKLDKLTSTGDAHAFQMGKLTNRVTRLSETNIALQAGIMQREKDTAKLEGKLEMVTASLVDAVGALRELSGSTNALWTVVGQVAPDLVRPRNGS